MNQDALHQIELLGESLQEQLEIGIHSLQIDGHLQRLDLGPGVSNIDREQIIDSYGFTHTGVYLSISN